MPVCRSVLVLVLSAWWVAEVLVSKTTTNVRSPAGSRENKRSADAPALGDVSERVVSDAGVRHASLLKVADVEDRQTPVVVTRQTALAVLRAELVNHLGDELRRPTNDEGLTQFQTNDGKDE